MTKKTQVPIAKAKQEKLKQALYVVLEPETVDAHGDIYSEDEVRKACHNFNRSHAFSSLFHLIETDGFHLAESYCAPVEMELNGSVIKAGTWLANVQFTDEELWEANEAGKFSGLSIGAMAAQEILEE